MNEKLFDAYISVINTLLANGHSVDYSQTSARNIVRDAYLSSTRSPQALRREVPQ